MKSPKYKILGNLCGEGCYPFRWRRHTRGGPCSNTIPIVATVTSYENWTVHEHQNQKYVYGHGALILLILLASSIDNRRTNSTVARIDLVPPTQRAHQIGLVKLV